jgi:hypothetical protein
LFVHLDEFICRHVDGCQPSVVDKQRNHHQQCDTHGQIVKDESDKGKFVLHAPQIRSLDIHTKHFQKMNSKQFKRSTKQQQAQKRTSETAQSNTIV